MSEFWPTGFELSDTQSPKEILESAQKEWAEQGDGVLLLVLQTTQSERDNDMIIVDAKHVPSNRTTTLFEVLHRPGTPYPVTIQPKGGDLPNFLKKSYHQPGIGAVVQTLIIQGHDATNEWVADTPSEFREKLKKVFNLGTTKSEILNLVSGGSSEPADSADGDHTEGEE